MLYVHAHFDQLTGLTATPYLPDEGEVRPRLLTVATLQPTVAGI